VKQAYPKGTVAKKIFGRKRGLIRIALAEFIVSMNKLISSAILLSSNFINKPIRSEINVYI
jgi:hypothetical protein